MSASKKTAETVKIGKEAVDAAVKAGTEAFKNYEDVLSLSKGNIDAMVASGSLFAKGMQDINKAWFELAQTSIEESAKVAKAVLASKSLPEAVEIQSNFVKGNYDKAMADSQKIADMSVKLVEEVSAPLNERVNLAVETFSKPLAA